MPHPKKRLPPAQLEKKVHHSSEAGKDKSRREEKAERLSSKDNPRAHELEEKARRKGEKGR